MSWLSELFSSSVAGVVDSVGNAIDKLVTSDEEKLAMKNELIKIQAEAVQKAEDQSLKAEEEITKRWTSDNEHIITRLVRPISYAWVVILFSVVMIGDNAFGINVKEAYIPVLETLLTTMTVAYFGSRGVEKGIKHFKGARGGS